MNCALCGTPDVEKRGDCHWGEYGLVCYYCWIGSRTGDELAAIRERWLSLAKLRHGRAVAKALRQLQGGRRTPLAQKQYTLRLLDADKRLRWEKDRAWLDYNVDMKMRMRVR